MARSAVNGFTIDDAANRFSDSFCRPQNPPTDEAEIQRQRNVTRILIDQSPALFNDSLDIADKKTERSREQRRKKEREMMNSYNRSENKRAKKEEKKKEKLRKKTLGSESSECITPPVRCLYLGSMIPFSSLT